MKFTIITLFPDFIKSLDQYSIIGRAKKNKKIEIRTIDLREFGIGPHKQVDDKPYGGGVGMLLKVDVVSRTIKYARKKAKSKHIVIMLSPEGKSYSQEVVEKYTNFDEIIILCGHYEGFDARITNLVDEVISIGPYVLTGGEIPAMAIVDSVSRHISGVLGKDYSSETESFSISGGKRIIEYPQYTRPEEFNGKKVPEILLSGDHKKIAAWQESKKKTIKF
jgi:tRNA (guanine37-N1)-methyltransferase